MRDDFGPSIFSFVLYPVLPIPRVLARTTLFVVSQRLSSMKTDCFTGCLMKLNVATLQVKFFERVKLERKIESLQRKAVQEDLTDEDRGAAASLLACCKEDLQVHSSPGEGKTHLGCQRLYGS